jgi:arylsulfatase A-like enzyme
VAWNDLHLGMLVAELRRLGLLENTLILVTGDHGEEFLDHGGWDHAKTLYHEQVRVPLAGRLPESDRQDYPAGSLIHHPGRVVDIYPSVLDFLGVESTSDQLAGLDGRSFFAEQAGTEAPLLFSEENRDEHLLFSVEQGRYKFIRRLKPEPGDELYDLQVDPGETTDIIAEHPELARRLAEAGEKIRRNRTPEREAADLDEATREELRALGYME